VNSFRFVEKAIEVEFERQADILEGGGEIVQETRLYDANKNETRSMRSKEVAHDYRYFPEPDLLPVEISEAFIEATRAQLPELPTAKIQRFKERYGLNAYDASVLCAERALADFYEQVVEVSGDAKISANWVMVELLALLNRDGLKLADSKVSADDLGLLVKRILDGTISGKIAKQVFDSMWNGEGTPDAIIEAKGLRQVADTGLIEAMVDETLANNAEQVEKYRATPADKRVKMFGFFVGQVMKASKGKANPQQVNDLLRQKLESE